MKKLQDMLSHDLFIFLYLKKELISAGIEGVGKGDGRYLFKIINLYPCKRCSIETLKINGKTFSLVGSGKKSHSKRNGLPGGNHTAVGQGSHYQIGFLRRRHEAPLLAGKEKNETKKYNQSLKIISHSLQLPKLSIVHLIRADQ
jgi:hypothetical protein